MSYRRYPPFVRLSWNVVESLDGCQVDGGWQQIQARVGGQGQHVGCEHFDGEDEEEEDHKDVEEDDDDGGDEDDDQDDNEDDDKDEDEDDKEDDGEDDDGGQGQHMGRGRLCQHVASRVSQGNRPDRAALRRRDK